MWAFKRCQISYGQTLGETCDSSKFLMCHRYILLEIVMTGHTFVIDFVPCPSVHYVEGLRQSNISRCSNNIWNVPRASLFIEQSKQVWCKTDNKRDIAVSVYCFTLQLISLNSFWKKARFTIPRSIEERMNPDKYV